MYRVRINASVYAQPCLIIAQNGEACEKIILGIKYVFNFLQNF
jgi:hypothetical protein